MDRGKNINNQSDSPEIASTSKSGSSIPTPRPNMDSAEKIKLRLGKTPRQVIKPRIPISNDPSRPSTSVLPIRTNLSSQSFSGAKAHSKIPVLAKKTVAPVVPVANNTILSSSNRLRTPLINEIRLPVENGTRSSATQRVLSPTRPVGDRKNMNNSYQNYPKEKFVLKEPRMEPSDIREQCPICTRLFIPDRLIVHEKICKKAKTKKRKAFDSLKHRVQGTDAESYLRHPLKQQATKQIKKVSWRKQHEEFISTIRAAKEAQVYLAKGGKLSDLPPPPPSDTSHYTPCPHCGRKFNQTAAARHIPICAEMVHNKPKPRTTQTKVVPNNRRTK